MKICSLFLLIGFFGTLHSQAILEIDREVINKNEFLRVYLKNNQSETKFTEKELDEFIDLYSLYKMKLIEAKALKLDTSSSLKLDYEKYTDQLAQNIVLNSAIENNLLKEEYNRMKSDLKISHILVSVTPNASPQDTLLAYNKIKYIQSKLTPTNFETVAKENSEDKTSAPLGGLVGYITALMTSTDFETAAYYTPVGQTSQIFRSQYGYHIIKVIEKRPARGKVKVAHIYTSGTDAMEKANQAYQDVVKKKLTFSQAVEKYSQDQSTKATEGVLPPFGVSEMVAQFEDAAFSLNKPGDITKPFQSQYGWHIIELKEKIPLKTFEEEKSYIRNKLENSDELKRLRQSIMVDQAKKLGLKENKESLNLLKKNLSDSFFSKSNWKIPSIPNSNSTILISISGNNLTMVDFINYINQNYQGTQSYKRDEFIDAIYSNYLNRTIWDYTKKSLSKTNEDYQIQEKEYYNGLLIFELMDKKIWTKSIQDSIATKKIYEQTKNNYQSNKKVKLDMIQTNQESIVPDIYKAIGTAPNIETAYKNLLKTKDSLKVSHLTDIFELGNGTIADKINLESKAPFTQKDPNTKVISVGTITEIIPPGVKKYDEVKGKIQSEYQKNLEQNFNKYLTDKYPIRIYYDELKKLVK